MVACASDYSRLVHLDLRYNNFSRKELEEGKKLLNANRNLIGLHLEGNSGTVIDSKGFLFIPGSNSV
jgi:hypothetical protein